MLVRKSFNNNKNNSKNNNENNFLVTKLDNQQYNLQIKKGFLVRRFENNINKVSVAKIAYVP